MLKAIIFDLEGTLVETESLHYKAHKRALADYGIRISEEDYIKEGAYKKPETFYFAMSDKYKVFLSETGIRKVGEKKQKYYLDFLARIKLYPGTRSLLKHLQHDFALAIASSTSKKIISTILSSTQIANLFAVVVSGHDVKRNKPFPDIYLEAAKKLKILPERCMAVEDSEVGVLSAKSAGMTCVAIPNTYTKPQNFSKADIVLGDINEIKSYLSNHLK